MIDTVIIEGWGSINALACAKSVEIFSCTEVQRRLVKLISLDLDL